MGSQTNHSCNLATCQEIHEHPYRPCCLISVISQGHRELSDSIWKGKAIDHCGNKREGYSSKQMSFLIKAWSFMCPDPHQLLLGMWIRDLGSMIFTNLLPCKGQVLLLVLVLWNPCKPSERWHHSLTEGESELRESNTLSEPRGDKNQPSHFLVPCHGGGSRMSK